MDVLYLHKHSRLQDEEMRFSLRSLDRYAPWAETIWIFGDRPRFLDVQHDRIRHVTHEFVTAVTGERSPLKNTFKLLFHASLIPELSQEFVWMCDDYVFLDTVTEEHIRKYRVMEDLAHVKNRGRGLWKDSLWRTHDLLLRFGYPRWNFETHTPTYLTRRMVFEAYAQFRDFTTDDRFYGPLAHTAILNHAFHKESFELTLLNEEGLLAGFHHSVPEAEAVTEKSQGKLFLNHDEDSYPKGVREFLFQQFPERAPYEVDDTPTAAPRHLDTYNQPLEAGVFLPTRSEEQL